MSEPVVVTVTASGWGCGKRSAPSFGLWGSLHAVATTSVAAAPTHQLRPTLHRTGLLRLGVRGNVGAKTGPPSEPPNPRCPQRSLAPRAPVGRGTPLRGRDAVATGSLTQDCCLVATAPHPRGRGDCIRHCSSGSPTSPRFSLRG